jgi:streptogramin lyase
MARLVVATLVVASLLFAAASTSAAPLKGDGPTSIAIGFGSVWIGMGNGDIVRLDARTGKEQARFRGDATSFVHGLTVAYGAVWGARGRIVRIEPRRNTVREVRGVGSATLFAIGGAGGALWLVDDDSNDVLRIDPTRMRLAARIPVPGRAWGLAAGNDSLIVVSVPNGGGPVSGPGGLRLLRRLDPRTNRLSAPLARVGCDPGVTFGAGAVWTFDFCSGVLARRDPSTLRVSRRAKLGVLSQKPAVAFGSVWLASRGGVLRIDPATLRVVARIPARSLTVAIGEESVWAFDPVHSVVRKIDPRTNRVVARLEIGAKR